MGCDSRDLEVLEEGRRTRTSRSPGLPFRCPTFPATCVDTPSIVFLSYRSVPVWPRRSSSRSCSMPKKPHACSVGVRACKGREGSRTSGEGRLDSPDIPIVRPRQDEIRSRRVDRIENTLHTFGMVRIPRSALISVPQPDRSVVRAGYEFFSGRTWSCSVVVSRCIRGGGVNAKRGCKTHSSRSSSHRPRDPCKSGSGSPSYEDRTCTGCGLPRRAGGR